MGKLWIGLWLKWLVVSITPISLGCNNPLYGLSLTWIRSLRTWPLPREFYSSLKELKLGVKDTWKCASYCISTKLGLKYYLKRQNYFANQNFSSLMSPEVAASYLDFKWNFNFVSRYCVAQKSFQKSLRQKNTNYMTISSIRKISITWWRICPNRFW